MSTLTIIDNGRLGDLACKISMCRGCDLAATRSKTVPAWIGPRYRPGGLMLLGEAPGASEDQTGLPFIGRSGNLLDKWLVAAGTGRAEVAIANVVRCRPPGNAKPKPEQRAACAGWLAQELQALAPGVIVVLGETAARALVRDLPQTAMKHLLGSQHVCQHTGAAVVISYHPSYILQGAVWAAEHCIAALKTAHSLLSEKADDQP